jgi:hypothetical protein
MEVRFEPETACQRGRFRGETGQFPVTFGRGKIHAARRHGCVQEAELVRLIGSVARQDRLTGIAEFGLELDAVHRFAFVD